MSAKPMDWVQGPWTVELHTISRSTYDGLRLDDVVFPHWIISYVQEGNVRTGSGGEFHRVKAGEVMLHPPNLPFTEHADGRGAHLWLQASILCSHHLDLLQLYRVSPVVAIPEPVKFEKVFFQLQSAWSNRKQSFRDLKLTSGMLQLTEQILAGWENAGSVERSEAYESEGNRYARLVGHMSSRLADKLDREQLAAYVRLSPNYLDRVFQAEYGLTPMQMLRDLRLKHSRLLLQRSEETLESIALQCGMNDASYLCKQFKKHYGMLPGQYRELALSAQAEDLYGGTAGGVRRHYR
ncbi:AraC family transcriptional regulator [Cohnella endophytica]|uniref:AraC family transcriptional regulator n=1 Tax=Cohnella endophytica TaxID=2419778 RepID=A0A494XT34_9BACL|nr:AraC family transcriptional regulator [Cohnella endophytica]RKP52982.1 AraC family transcriptional regulator [Cohnella endophytica]